MTAPRPPASLEEVLAVLRARREDVRARKRIDILGVFGSLARGEARVDSDVDVLADFLEGTTLFRVAEVQIELETVLGRPVDLVDRQGLRAFARAGVERDFVVA